MNKIEEGFLRLCLRPRVTCDLPGRLRLCFEKYRLLPEAAAPYLHYIRDVLELLPGVLQAEINPRIGTALIRYDAAATDARTILGWVDTGVDEGIRVFREGVWKNKGETELEEIARRRLILRLSQQNEGKV